MQHSGKDTRRTAAGLAAIAAGVVLIIGGLPGGAGAAPMQTATPTSSIVTEMPDATCDSLGEYDFSAKIDEEPEEKTYTDIDGTGLDVEITSFTPGEGDDPAMVSLTTNFPISAVYVKAGPGGILYTSDPPAMIWTDLESPKPSISHLSFCWNEEDKVTTTTEDDGSTTTEDEGSTTTEKGEGSTTTEKGEETTTTVEGETTTTVEGETTSTTAAGGVTTTTVSDGELPRTGNNMAPMLGLGAALLAGGTALIAGTRRLRNSQN